MNDGKEEDKKRDSRLFLFPIAHRAHTRGSEWGGPFVGCRLKFSYFVGSRLKFSIFVGSRLNFLIFVGCPKISVNK